MIYVIETATKRIIQIGASRRKKYTSSTVAAGKILKTAIFSRNVSGIVLHDLQYL